MRKTLQGRVLKLEAAHGRRLFRGVSDDDLDAMLKAELRAWLATQPDACPEPLRAEVLAFVGAHDAEEKRL